MPLSLDNVPGKEVLSDTLVSSSVWKFLCIILILANFKNLPLVWHVSARLSTHQHYTYLTRQSRFGCSMLSASRIDPSGPGRLSDLRNCFNLSFPNRTAPSWNLTTTFTVSALTVAAFVSDPRPDHWTRRVKQHVFSGRRYCPNSSHLYFIFGWNRAREKK